MTRKSFSEVFESKKIGEGKPAVTLRRLSEEEEEKYNFVSFLGTTVGIFHGDRLIACVDMEDLFDESGNRFCND